MSIMSETNWILGSGFLTRSKFTQTDQEARSCDFLRLVNSVAESEMVFVRQENPVLGEPARFFLNTFESLSKVIIVNVPLEKVLATREEWKEELLKRADLVNKSVIVAAISSRPRELVKIMKLRVRLRTSWPLNMVLQFHNKTLTYDEIKTNGLTASLVERLVQSGVVSYVTGN